MYVVSDSIPRPNVWSKNLDNSPTSSTTTADDYFPHRLPRIRRSEPELLRLVSQALKLADAKELPAIISNLSFNIYDRRRIQSKAKTHIIHVMFALYGTDSNNPIIRKTEELEGLRKEIHDLFHEYKSRCLEFLENKAQTPAAHNLYTRRLAAVQILS